MFSLVLNEVMISHSAGTMMMKTEAKATTASALSRLRYNHS